MIVESMHPISKMPVLSLYMFPRGNEILPSLSSDIFFDTETQVNFNMIVLRSDIEIDKHLDAPSHAFILEEMRKDCPVFSEQIKATNNEWIGRVILFKGSDHSNSSIQYGFLLKYQFRKLNIEFEMKIHEIVIAESTDDFLDLYNFVRKDDSIFNREKRE